MFEDAIRHSLYVIKRLRILYETLMMLFEWFLNPLCLTFLPRMEKTLFIF
jgi:hypothetical protein